MLSGERQLEIINIIRESGVAEVEYLAKTLGVSTMTIRRDLKKLDESGLIERCYGGAVRKTEVTYEAKRIKNHESKIKIAANAAISMVAERQGFEPWEGVNPRRFSRPVH